MFYASGEQITVQTVRQNATATFRKKRTWKPIIVYTWTQIKVKEQLVVRKDMDVNEHERLSNITRRQTHIKVKNIL
jgi:hypothetical protein